MPKCHLPSRVATLRSVAIENMVKDRKILKSWKDIAAYLGVGVRTAQRWRDDRGLPVRQPGSGRRSAVLGLRDEIDRWLAHSDALDGRQPAGGVPAEIVVTDLLWSRPSRPRDFEREIQVLRDLYRALFRDDRNAVLSRVAEYALALCKAESAGFSILETTADGAEIFRWTATQGRMEAFRNGTTPAEFSPCGFCLERNSPQLFRYPEKHYTYLRPIAPLSELLLIPVHDEHAWLGTIWVMCHQKRRAFDREDARLMTELGALSSVVYLRDRLWSRKGPRLARPENEAMRAGR